MEDEAITLTDSQDSGVQATQPEEQSAEAVNTTESEPQKTDQTSYEEAESQSEPEAPAESDSTEEQKPEQTDNSEDDAEWLAKKGIDLEAPDAAAKLAKMYRNAEKAMHKNGQKASELEKKLQEQPVDVDTDNPLVERLANEVVLMKRADAVRNFKSEVNLTPEQEAKMVSYISENPSMSELVNAGYLSLQQLYKLSGAGEIDPDTVKAQGGQEALEKLASKQRATAPKGAASNSNGTSTPKDDPFLAGFNNE